MIPKKTMAWEFTDDAVGHLPKFEIKCKICDTPMFMRHSIVGLDNALSEAVNLIAYKCPACDWFIRFEVNRPKEEIEKILEHRGGKQKLIPTDMWVKQSDAEIIEQKLRDLGYV